MESKRGTEDPTYLYYTYGKLRDLEAARRLQEEARRRRTRLRKFHDAFLAEGAIPLPLVRRALLAP